MAIGFFTDDNSPESYEASIRKRRLADALLLQSQDGAPIQSWTQGAAKLMQSLSGTIQNKRLDAKERETSKTFNDALLKALSGGSSPSAPAMPPASGGAPMRLGSADENASLINSESGGNWQAKNDAVGHGGQRGHYGRLQFGHARLEDAKRAGIIPQSVTPQQFMTDPEMQKAVERWHFADIDNSIATGPASRAIGTTINGVPVTPQGLRAVAHLGGVGGMNRFVQSGGQYNPRDVNGTSLMDYMRQHGGGAPAPVQTASLDGLPPGPVASDAPPMAFAPQSAPQAINTAMQPPMPPPRPPAAGGAPAPAANAPAGPMPLPGAMPQAGGIAPSGLLQLAMDPRFSPQQRQMAMQLFQMGQRDDGVTFVDAGDRLIPMNRRGQQAGAPIPKAQAPRGPIAVGQDQRLVDPNTGREIAGAQGNRAPTVQKVKLPDGSEVAVQWDKQRNEWVPLNAPQGGNPVAPTLPKLTEQQSKDVGFVQRGKAANEALTPDAEKALLSVPDTALQNLPEVLGMNVGRRFQNEKFQTAFNAGRNFLAVVLRKDTGAAITREEWKEYTPLFIPQPGDTPDLLTQKRENRKVAMQAMEDGLGNVGDILARVVAARKQSAPANPAAPAQNADHSGAIAAARDAIARGADPAAVRQRLQQNGIDPAGL